MKTRNFYLHLLLMSFIILIPLLSFGQSDSTKMIIDKKFTITFKDEIRLKQVKKTPEYKQVQVEPERNPIIYDKQAFYQSLNIKQSKTLEELFSYPLFTAYAAGGNLSSVNGGIGFQANAKKFIPSLMWDFEREETEKDDSERQKMNFGGGVRFHLTDKLNMNLNLLHRQVKSGDYNFLADTTDLDFESSYMKIGINSRYSTEQFHFNVGSVTEDFTHDYLDEFHFFQTGLNYQASMNFNEWSLYGNGEIQWAQNEFGVDDSEFSYYQSEVGVGYYKDKVSIKAGGTVLNHEDLIGNKNESLFAPALDFQFVPIPQKLTLFGNYSSYFQKPDINLFQNKYLYTVSDQFLPDIVKYEIKAGIEWIPMKNLVIREWYSTKVYDIFSIWNKSIVDTLYSRNTIYFNGNDKLKENSVNFSLEWEYKFFKITGGASFNFWDLVRINAPLLQSTSTIFINSCIDYKKFKIGTQIQYEGGREFYIQDQDELNFLILNINGQYPVYKKFSAILSLKNISNQKYEWIPGFQEPGFKIMAGLKYKF